MEEIIIQIILVNIEIPIIQTVIFKISLKKMTAASLDQREIYDWLGLVTARLHARLFQKISRPNSTTKNAKIIVSTQLFEFGDCLTQ